MLDLKPLLKHLKILLGEELDAGGEELAKELGLAAIEQVKSNLRPGVALEEGQHNLMMLCVAMAYYQYALIAAQKQMRSVKVGEVSVSGNGNKWIEAAKKLKDYYSKATRRYMKARFVEFLSV